MANNVEKDLSAMSRAALWIALLLAAAGLVVVFALPGPPPRKHPQRIPVQFWHMWTAEWKDVVDRIVDRFNESQNTYEVIALSVPMTSADSKFLLAVAGGSPPDVMAQWNPVIPKWAENGLMMKLNEFMSPGQWEEFQKTVYPAVKKIGMYKGDLYGVTTGLNAFACYVRLDYLREANIPLSDFPDTLEALVEWGSKLHKFDDKGNLQRVGYLPAFYHYYTSGFGNGFYNWTENKLTLNTPDNLRALNFMVDERKKLGFANVIRFESGLAIGLGNMDWPFITGAYTILVDGQWRVEQLARYAPNLDYATVPIPPPKGGRPHFGFTNGNFMIIPKGAREPEGAWEFIKFWSGLENPDRAAEFYTWGGWLPLCPAIAEAPMYREYVRAHPQFQTFLDLLPSENMDPMPPVPYQVFLFDRIVRADEAATRGVLPPQQALDRLEKEVAQEIQSRKEFGYAH